MRAQIRTSSIKAGKKIIRCLKKYAYALPKNSRPKAHKTLRSMDRLLRKFAMRAKQLAKSHWGTRH